jgi:hypothetical protein
MCEALGSIPSTSKLKNKTKKTHTFLTILGFDLKAFSQQVL